MVLAEGQTAPAGFTLKSHRCEDVSLAAQRGRHVLLLFVLLAFTPV